MAREFPIDSLDYAAQHRIKHSSMLVSTVMNREPLRNYGDDELSLRVFNDEPRYRIRHSSVLFSVLVELYSFSTAQADVLRKDIEDDAMEALL